MRFNDPDADSEVLATVPITDPDSSRKRPRDDVEHEEELIEGSGLFAKRPRIPGCPDMKE